MSRLTQLILELCPGGVPNEKVGSLCRNISSSKKIKKTSYRSSGKYVIVDQGQDLVAGYTDDEDALVAHGEYVIFGEHTREVKYVDFPFAQGADGIKILKARSGVIPRYLYHALSDLNIPNRGYNRHWTIVKDMMVPLPPLSIQEEIVRILDHYTELTAELKAELTARQKQYDYYRDLLLTFDDSVPIMALGKICKNVSSGGTPATSRTDFYNGNIPWLRTQEVDWRDILDTEIKITRAGFDNCSAKWIPENCVIVAMYGATAAKVAINKIPLTTNQACCNLEIDASKALYRYVFHWLSKQYLTLKAMGQGSQSNINGRIIKGFKIPLPPLSEQQRIVDILDRFDTLVNDLTSGLPAEIGARRKQYEYYRDKLLTFKEVES